jgi:hypothetical protein
MLPTRIHQETLLNTDSVINNERQDCKIGTGGGGGYLWEEEGEEEMKVWDMVDGLRIHMGNRTMKPLAIALSGEGMSLRWSDVGGDLTNVQCKPIQNCPKNTPCTTDISQ